MANILPNHFSGRKVKHNAPEPIRGQVLVKHVHDVTDASQQQLCVNVATQVFVVCLF